VAALRDLKPYLLKYRGSYTAGALTVVISSAFMIVKPRLVQQAIDSIEEGIDLPFLTLCALGIVGVTIVRGFFLFLTRRLMIYASRRLENDIRNDLLRHLQRLNPTFYHAHPTGDLMALATNDLAAVRQMAGPGIMYSVNTIVSGTFVLVNLILISPLLSLVTLSTLPIMAFVVYRFGRAIHTRFERIQDRFGNLTAITQENLSGVRLIRSYAREDHEAALFDEANLEYMRLNKGYLLIDSAFRPAIMFVVGLGLLLLLYMGGSFIMQDRITVGEFTAFAIYFSMLIWPAISVGWVTGLFQRGAASMKRIQRIFNAKPEVGDPAGAVAGDGDDLRIEIRDLSFRYGEQSPWVLRNISLVIEPGSTLAIVGPTGAGKTTLLNLLVHLFPLPRGMIRIVGHDINDISLAGLRGLIGFVPQEAFLFSDTIANNIAFAPRRGNGRPPLEVDDAARKAAFHDEVSRFSQGFDTMLGERGINLSGGQRQRCAIARALTKNPEILILDDALSAVDTRTEDEILDNLEKIAKGRTVIIVSHRVSAVRKADRIVVLRDGAIEESGRHGELVAAGGLYADMVEQQRLKSELEVI